METVASVASGGGWSILIDSAPRLSQRLRHMIISVSRQKGAEGRESIKLAGNGKRSQGGGLAGWLAGYGEASSEQYCSPQSSLCPAATSCLLVSDRSLRPQVCVTDESIRCMAMRGMARTLQPCVRADGQG